jgi:hypothetical protein
MGLFIAWTNSVIRVPPEHIKDDYVQKAKDPLSGANSKRYNVLFIQKSEIP